MMVVAAIAILVGFSVLIWRSMPHEVDRSPGGHWTPEPTPSVPSAPSAPAEPDADPEPTPAPTPSRRSAPLDDPDGYPIGSCARRGAPLVSDPGLLDDVDDDCDDPDDDDCDDDVDDDPDPLDETTPYDSKRCWGCEKRCTYRRFRVPEGGTRDEIHRIAERKYRAEHGCASDLDAVDGSDVGNYSPAADEVDFDPIAVARRVGAAKRAAWFEQCEQCVSDLRARRDNPPAQTMEPSAVVAEECPF